MADAIRILVVSDSHGRMLDVRRILRSEQADALFFLGDVLRDLEDAVEAETVQKHPPRWPIYRARGNCDHGWPDYPSGPVYLGGMAIYYTHGNSNSEHGDVKFSGPEGLAAAYARRGADIVLYGHTHQRDLLPAVPGIRPAAFNPGSLRDQGCYGLITIRDGHADYSWRFLRDL